MLKYVEKEVGEKITATVIWLHGLGADGNDFLPLVPDLQIASEIGIRFIFPHAPAIPVTINGGYVMPAWFDVLKADIDREVDLKQLLESASGVCELIEEEISKGIASERIIIAGFSQGGAVAYEAVLSNNHKLGGILALSTYFATHDSIEYSAVNAGVDIQIHHGAYDDVVNEELGKKAHNILVEKAYSVNYTSFPMGHSVCPEQIGMIGAWLNGKLAK